MKEFTLADTRDVIEMRGVLEGTASRLAAERLTNTSIITNDRELDPLCRPRDELDAMPVPAIDSFARYLDLNEAYMTLVDLAQQFQVAADDETGSGSPVGFPERFGVGQLQAPQGLARRDRRGA